MSGGPCPHPFPGLLSAEAPHPGSWRSALSGFPLSCRLISVGPVSEPLRAHLAASLSALPTHRWHWKWPTLPHIRLKSLGLSPPSAALVAPRLPHPTVLQFLTLGDLLDHPEHHRLPRGTKNCRCPRLGFVCALTPLL